MRIGIFSESYEPIVNGVSVCVNTLRDSLVARGHEVFIFAASFDGFTDSYKNVVRIPSHHSFLMKDYPFPLPYAPEAYQKFLSYELDIVHTQTPFILGLLGRRWARKAGIPIVSTNHTLYTEYVHYVPVRPKSITKFLLMSLMRWYYNRCDGVVVPSNPVKEMLITNGIKYQVTVIKTGVADFPDFSHEDRMNERQRLGIEESSSMILYVGRIAREKNLTTLINSYKKVLESFTNARLVMVGNGPALDETKAYVKSAGLSDKITFTGMLRGNDIKLKYAAADIFVFPSTTETQGIAICEAMSAGLPVVAANAGGIPENVQDGVDGFLLSNDPREFADKIIYLINNPEAQAIMSKNAKKNSKNFSIDKMADEFEKYYESVIENHKRE